MTPSALKYNVEQVGDVPYYFNRKTMKFFGDTMKNYGCRSNKIIINEDQENEEIVEVWELYRKKPVKHGLQASTFFRKDNFQRVRW